MQLSGNITDFFLAFGGGILVSFSPCVYPLVPITISYIGIQSTTSRLKGFILSAIYVLGIATTYSLLGAIASLSGKLFGQISTHPLSYIIAGNIFILFGLSFWDVFAFSSFGLFIQNRVKINNLWTVFLFGLVSGLVVGPCTAPALGAILVYVATKQNVLYGLLLLFTFAYGAGTILILSGTFGGLLLNLTKSSQWLVRIKRLSGLILIIAGEYFLIKAGGLM